MSVAYRQYFGMSDSGIDPMTSLSLPFCLPAFSLIFPTYLSSTLSGQGSFFIHYPIKATHRQKDLPHQ